MWAQLSQSTLLHISVNVTGVFRMPTEQCFHFTSKGFLYQKNMKISFMQNAVQASSLSHSVHADIHFVSFVYNFPLENSLNIFILCSNVLAASPRLASLPSGDL